MPDSIPVSVFWFRRDLRLDDNAGLYHALKSQYPVLPIFIFDKNILNKLEDADDARVSFIHKSLVELNNRLITLGSSLSVKFATPVEAFSEILSNYNVKEIYTNSDYEPYARARDLEITSLLLQKNIQLLSFKDHVVFEKTEVVKADNSPYTVFTAYKRRWLEKLKPDFHLKHYPNKSYFNNFYQCSPFSIPTLKEIGFQETPLPFPDKEYNHALKQYAELRDFPATEGTSKIGIHLRFGTLSIRELAAAGLALSNTTWVSELIWRDFYGMILWQFPESAKHSFKKDFEKISWRNNEQEFAAWCQGKTGYPIVDAGMRQLNATGWMHNRVRMITASFLTKHLLIDWRWGEAYFARKLLDYDQASNVGGWQWAAGTGNDAAPYFRVFSPDLQTKRFDPQLAYIKKWIPEFGDPFKYVKPIVDHKFARERALNAYKQAITR